LLDRAGNTQSRNPAQQQRDDGLETLRTEVEESAKCHGSALPTVAAQGNSCGDLAEDGGASPDFAGDGEKGG
jgi:hypothetical protein